MSEHNEKCANGAAKWREALEKADKALALISKSAWFMDANFHETTEVMEAGMAIEAALAVPPRNCDKYPTFNDAIRALADKRGWHDAKWDSERYCVLAQWLYAPATEKEGDVV